MTKKKKTPPSGPKPLPPIDETLPLEGPSRSGGIDVSTQGDTNIGGDAVGRDKIVKQIIQPPLGVLALHQLPPPPPDFTGRQSDLSDLLEKFQQGITIFGVQGGGGVGKTALALKLAEQLIGRYSDAQIFLDLKGSSSAPLSAYDIMAYIIRSFQPTAKLPDNSDALTAAYRSVLFEQRALLLFDNVRDAEQIKPLWPPPPSCAVIVTSRIHFPLAGLYLKNLAILSTDDARALLLQLASRIGERADEIAKLCGYLPLALRPVASQVKMRESLMIAACIEKLSDKQQRLKFLHSAADYIGEPSVDAALAASYELLSKDLQKLWCTLAVFSGEFNSAEASAVWGCSPETAHDLLEELRLYSLIEYTGPSDRWYAHDLVRVFVEEKLARNSRERKKATDNIVKSLNEGTALRGEQAVLFGKRLSEPAWQLSEIRPAVLAALWNLVEGADASEQRLAAGLQLLDLRWWRDEAYISNPEKELAFLELVAEVADTEVQRRWLSECITSRLKIKLHARQQAQLFIYRAALQAQLYQFLDRAEQLAVEGQQLNAAAKQDYDNAEQLIRLLIDSQEALSEDHRQLARVYMGKGNFASIEAEICQDGESEELFQKALGFYTAAWKVAQDYCHDKAFLVKILGDFCRTYAFLKEWKNAEEQYSKAMGLLEKDLKTDLEARDYASLYFVVQNSAAQMYYAWAEAVKEDRLSDAQDQYERACRLTLAAISQLRGAVGDSEDLAIAHFNVGDYLQALNDLGEACKHWQLARDIAHRRGVWHVEHLSNQRLLSLGCGS